MEVIVAKSAGFCFGVERAVKSAYDEAGRENEKIYTYGPIIHNEQVTNDLAKKGVNIINSLEELESLDSGIVIMRAHGVSKSVYDKISKNVKVVDATCPFVSKIHRIVNEESSKGKHIIIIGNDGHPEVEGIKGWAVGKTFVISSEQDALEFADEMGASLCIVSQTTFNVKKFHKLVEIIEKKGYNSSVVNTICDATSKRQAEAGQLASRVDAMIVVGGVHSSNTQKLYEICKNECSKTYLIQTVDDLQDFMLAGCNVVGITAGASTPNNITEEVQNYVRRKF